MQSESVSTDPPQACPEALSSFRLLQLVNQFEGKQRENYAGKTHRSTLDEGLLVPAVSEQANWYLLMFGVSLFFYKIREDSNV